LFDFGSGESGKSLVSAEKVKNGACACDNGFKVGYFGREAVEFPILLKQHTNKSSKNI